MSFELPQEPRAARRAAIGRWISFALIVVLIILLGYLGYVGFTGSARLTDAAAASTDCRTPAIANGWTYEAINYDASTDAALADNPDPADCPQQGEEAGSSLVTPDGVRLAGWYIPAGNGMGPEGPTVILAHGYEANKSTMLAHAALLHDEYNLVLFDFRNHGQSTGDETTQGALEQTDLREVVDWLDRRKGAGADRAAGGVHGRGRGPGRVDCRRPDRRRHPGLDPRHRSRGHPGPPGCGRLPALAARLMVDPARIADTHRGGHQRRRPGAARRATTATAGRC